MGGVILVAGVMLCVRQVRAAPPDAGIPATGVDFAFPDGGAQFASLSRYDCLHNNVIDFDFIAPWVSGQEAEFIVSLDSSCPTPGGSSFPNSTASCANQTCPSVVLDQPNGPLPEPADQMTTDFEGMNPQNPLSTAGLWGFYATQINSMSGANNYNPLNTNCPTGVPANTPVYVCAVLSTAASQPPGVTPFGALPFILDSTPPATPGQPTVTPLDSGFEVTWTAVPDAAYYNVIVALASGGSDVDAGIAVVSQAVTTYGTTAEIFGLTNGTEYLVFLQALDGAGSNPPVTSNASSLSPPASGTPAAVNDASDGGSGASAASGCSGCSSGDLPGAFALLVSLWFGRRKHAAVTAGLRS